VSIIDEAISANQDYARTFQYADLPRAPARKLAVVTCMDSRMMLDQILGFGAGDANVLRNAGGIVTEDVIRSLIISHHLLGTREVMVINHTDCGLLSFNDEDMHLKLQAETGAAVVAPAHFYTFRDLRANVRQQIRRVQSHPWVPSDVVVRGFIYDVKSGVLTEETL
jgi:carbonic anhydrase